MVVGIVVVVAGDIAVAPAPVLAAAEEGVVLAEAAVAVVVLVG